MFSNFLESKRYFFEYFLYAKVSNADFLHYSMGHYPVEWRVLILFAFFFWLIFIKKRIDSTLSVIAAFLNFDAHSLLTRW